MIVPGLLDALARGGEPDRALVAADRFFQELPTGLRLISALAHNPDLVRLLATILGTAPRLGEMLAHRPSLIDALLDPTFFGALPDEAALEARLTALLAEAEDEEDLLDRARRFRQEYHVLLGVRILAGTLSANRAGEAFARLADVLIRGLATAVKARFAETHGAVKDAEVAVLAMGKLGGREMTAGSDLDLIMLYDFDEEHPESDGARPLYGAQYFARLTQRLVSALTTPTNAGQLYEVDLRLRPSGRAGPVATRLAAFEIYQCRGSLDLGAHGADPGAGGLRLQGLSRQGGEGHCHGAAPRAQPGAARRRHRRHARRHRRREGRGRSLGSGNTPPAA